MVAGVALLLAMAACDSALPELTAGEVMAKIEAGEDVVILDVREPSEFRRGHIRGAVNLPWTSRVLQRRHAQLPADRPIIVVCRSGRRSAEARSWLMAQGFDDVTHMADGMSAWGYGVATAAAPASRGPVEAD